MLRERSAFVGQNAIVFEYPERSIRAIRQRDFADRGFVHLVMDDRIVFFARARNAPDADLLFPELRVPKISPSEVTAQSQPCVKHNTIV